MLTSGAIRRRCSLLVAGAVLVGCLAACGDAPGGGEADASQTPEETWVEPVLAQNAKESATEVLSGLDDADLPSSDEIAQQIVDKLVMAPGQDADRMAVPSVVVDGTRVGVAMGWSSSCVLVHRVDGVVEDVYVPDVSLQPGEMGCAGWTAITTPPSTH